MSIVDEELEAQNIRVDPSKEQDLNVDPSYSEIKSIAN